MKMNMEFAFLYGVNKMKKISSTRKALINQIILLLTNSLGLVAALAWNNVVQELVNVYIKPYISVGSGIISLIIYAIIVTVFMVIIVNNLAKLK